MTNLLGLVAIVSSLALLSCTPKVASRASEQWTESKSYDMTAIGARRVGSNKVIALMRVTPKDPDKFKLILSMKVGYGSTPITNAVDIQKPNPDGRIQLVVYGNDIEQKSPEAYSVMAGTLDPDLLGEDRLVAVNLFGLIPQTADSLYLTYGLWEQDDMNQRIEKTYGMKLHQ